MQFRCEARACKQLNRFVSGLSYCGLVLLLTQNLMASNVSCGSVWEDEQVRALIAIWGETKVQEELDGATRYIKK